MSDGVRDVGDVWFEQVRSGGGGGVVVTPAEVRLMDDPGADPAVQAAADVKWWFLQASGLQRLVDLGDEVRSEEGGSRSIPGEEVILGPQVAPAGAEHDPAG